MFHIRPVLFTQPASLKAGDTLHSAPACFRALNAYSRGLTGMTVVLNGPDTISLDP